MIISKLVTVRNSKYYKDLGYGNDKYVEIKVSDLSKGSRVLIKAGCYYCGLERDIAYWIYNKSVSYNNRYACSIKCASIKSKETNLDRYGVTCTLHSANVRIKTKKTVLEKYTVDNVFQSEIIKDKIKETN